MRFLLCTILCILLPCLGAYATTEHIDLTFRKNIFFDNAQYQAVAALPLLNGGNVAVVSIPNGNSGCVNTACVGLFLYGTNGQLLPGMPIVKNGALSTVTAAAIDRVGRIVVIGTTPSTGTNLGFGVLRFNSNGTDDGGFNGTGGTRIDFDQGGNNNDIPTALAIDSDNSIVIVGWVVVDGNNHTEFGIARLTANGSLDSNFGNGGKERIDFDLNGAGGDQATAVAIGSDHKIIVGGNAYDGTVYHPVLAQLFAAGVLDQTFCPTACTTTATLGFNNIYAGRLVYFFGSFPPPLHDDHLNSVDVSSNGDIVIAGNTIPPGNTSVAAAVAHLSANGNYMNEEFETGREGNASFTGVRFTNVPSRAVIAAGETGTLSRSFIVQAFGSDLSFSADYGNCLSSNSAICFVGNNFNLAHSANQKAAPLSLDSSGRPLFAGTYVGQGSVFGTVQQSVLMQRISNDSDSIFQNAFE